jgi:hypothetical protein
MRERRWLADLWPSCPWPVLEACRDPSVPASQRPSVSPPNYALPAQPGHQGTRAARHQRGHQPGQGTSQGTADRLSLLMLLLLIILRCTRVSRRHGDPRGLLLARGRIYLCLICRRASSSILDPPSSSTQVLLAHPVLPCFVSISRGTRQGWLGWLGWESREIDTILRLFLARLPPRATAASSRLLAASQPQLHMPHATHATPATHATCHMPHAMPLLLCPNTLRSPAPHPAQCQCQCQCQCRLISRRPLTAVAALSLGHLGRPRLAWCPRRLRPRPFLPHSPPFAFRVCSFAASYERHSSALGPPNHRCTL